MVHGRDGAPESAVLVCDTGGGAGHTPRLDDPEQVGAAGAARAGRLAGTRSTPTTVAGPMGDARVNLRRSLTGATPGPYVPPLHSAVVTSVTLVGGTRTSGRTQVPGGTVIHRKTWRRSATRWLAPLLALVLIASACGGGDDDDDSSGGGGEHANPRDEGTPVPGGEITYGLEAETAGGWCLPEAQLAISGIQVARAIYDTLTAPDENGEIKPFLAESVEPNADNTVWTIKLRDGIKFHDGTALDATVVKNNLDAYRGAYPAASRCCSCSRSRTSRASTSSTR